MCWILQNNVEVPSADLYEDIPLNNTDILDAVKVSAMEAVPVCDRVDRGDVLSCV